MFWNFNWNECNLKNNFAFIIDLIDKRNYIQPIAWLHYSANLVVSEISFILFGNTYILSVCTYARIHPKKLQVKSLILYFYSNPTAVLLNIFITVTYVIIC